MEFGKAKSLAVVLLLVGIICEVFGYLLYGAPKGPDELFYVTEVIGAFLIFLFWLTGIIAWGQSLSFIIFKKPTFLNSLLMGSVFASLLGGCFGYVGLIGAGYKSLFIAVLLTGLIINVLLFYKKVGDLDFRFNYKNYYLFIFIIIFFIHLINSFNVHTFWDPLWYHLTAPRQWFEEGRIYFSPKSISMYLASTWEYLFIWANQLLAHPNGEGIIAVQFFGQWTHLFIGFAGSLLATKAVITKLENNHNWVNLATLALATSFAFSYVTPLAKNDWGIFFWMIGGLAILLSLTSVTEVVFAGVLWGFALSGKFSAVFTLIAYLIYWLLVTKNKKNVFVLFLSITLAGLFIWIRNYLSIKNPFFPALSNIFLNNNIGPTWQEALLKYEGHLFGFGAFKIIIKELFYSSTLTILFFVFPYVWQKEKNKKYLSYSLLLVFVLFLTSAGEYSELRIVGGVALLMTALAVLVIKDLCIRLKIKEAVIYYFTLIIIAFIGYVPWKSTLRMYNNPNPSLQIRQYIGGGSLAWIRENVKNKSEVLFLADNRLYYIAHLLPVRVWDYPDLDRELRKTNNVKEKIRIMRDYGFKYLVNTTEPLDYFYDSQITKEIIDQIEAHKSKVLDFNNNSSYVVNLVKLQKELIY